MIASESIRGHHNNHNHHKQQQLQHNQHYNDSIIKQQQQVHYEADVSTKLARNTNSANALSVSIVPSPTNVATLDNDTLKEKYKNSNVLSTEENRATLIEINQVEKMNSNSINNKGSGDCTDIDGLKTNVSSTSLIVSHPNVQCKQFIKVCVEEIIESAVFDGTNRSNKVVQWHSPSELRELFDFKLKDDAESQEKLFDLIKKTIEYSVKTGHPYFINQLYSGVDPYALIGQWLTDALNPSVYTYEVAPVFTLMEEEVLSEMRRIVGFPNSGYGDGIFCPGGSIANGYAISCARFHKSPNTKVSKQNTYDLLHNSMRSLLRFMS